MWLDRFFRRKSVERHEDTEEQKKVGVLALGGMSAIGEKNCMAVFCGRDAVVIDCGEKVQNDAQGKEKPPDCYLDLEKLDDFNVLLLVLTHGHRDHVGSTFKFCQKFPHVPWMGHYFTLNTAEDDLRDHGIKTMPRRIEEQVYETSGFKITLFGVNHSIPGSCGVLVEAGGEAIVFTSDCKEWVVREDEDTKAIINKNKEVFGKLAEDRKISLLVLDSTNAERSGERVISENRVAKNIGDILDGEQGRVFIAAYASHVQRMRGVIQETRKRNRKVYVSGKGMRDMLHLGQVSGWHDLFVREGEGGKCKLYLSSDSEADPLDSNTLPADAVILCSGGQGEPDSFLRRMADNVFELPYKKGDTVIISQSVILRKEGGSHFEQMMVKLSARVDTVYLPKQTQFIPSYGMHVARCPLYDREGKVRIGSVHTSGHGNLDFKLMVWELLGRPLVLPWHGHKEIRQILVEAIRAQGGETLMLDDGEEYIIHIASPDNTAGDLLFGADVVL